MGTSTTNIGLYQPAIAEAGWGPTVNANCVLLDGLEALGGLAVRTFEVPSSTLKVTIAPGSFVNLSGVIVAYAGATLTLGASVTTRIWLTDAGVVATSTSAFPTGYIVPLATVVTGVSTVTSVTLARVPIRSAQVTATTPTVVVGAGAGTGGTATITGTDTAGYITIVAGTTPSASSTVATITFGVARAAAPKAVLIGAGSVNEPQPPPAAPPASYTTTSWVLSIGTPALTASTTYIFTYSVV